MLKADDRGAGFLDFRQSKFKSNISHVVNCKYAALLVLGIKNYHLVRFRIKQGLV